MWVYGSSGSGRPGNLTQPSSPVVCHSLAPLPLLEDGKDAGGLLSAALRTDPPPPC